MGFVVPPSAALPLNMNVSCLPWLLVRETSWQRTRFCGGGDILSHDLLSNNVFFLALQKLLPSIRREYDEAVQNASDLVANETKFLDFLRTDDMDPQKAALRLAMYWKYRKEIFAERWLLPMTQTGTGTLSTEDIRFLRTGYTSPINCPSSGPICLIDLSKLSTYPPGHTNTRIVFYLVTVMTDIGCQVDGVTIVHIVTSARRPPVSTDTEGWKMFREALPFRVKRLVVAQAYEQWKEALLDSLGYQVALAAGFRSQLNPSYIRGDSITSVATQLQAMGIERKCLPPSHGGSYDYSAF